MKYKLLLLGLALFSRFLIATQCPLPPMAPLKMEFAVNEPLLVFTHSAANAKEAAQYRWTISGKKGRKLPLKASLMGENFPLIQLLHPKLKPGIAYTVTADRSRFCKVKKRISCTYPILEHWKVNLTAYKAARPDLNTARWLLDKVTIHYGMVGSSGIYIDTPRAAEISGIPIVMQVMENPSRVNSPDAILFFYVKPIVDSSHKLIIGNEHCNMEPHLFFYRQYRLRLSWIDGEEIKKLAEWSIRIPPPPGLPEADMKLIEELNSLPGDAKSGTPEYTRAKLIRGDLALWERFRNATAKGVEFRANQLDLKSIP